MSSFKRVMRGIAIVILSVFLIVDCFSIAGLIAVQANINDTNIRNIAQSQYSIDKSLKFVVDLFALEENQTVGEVKAIDFVKELLHKEYVSNNAVKYVRETIKDIIKNGDSNFVVSEQDKALLRQDLETLFLNQFNIYKEKLIENKYKSLENANIELTKEQKAKIEAYDKKVTAVQTKRIKGIAAGMQKKLVDKIANPMSLIREDLKMTNSEIFIAGRILDNSVLYLTALLFFVICLLMALVSYSKYKWLAHASIPTMISGVLVVSFGVALKAINASALFEGKGDMSILIPIINITSTSFIVMGIVFFVASLVMIITKTLISKKNTKNEIVN